MIEASERGELIYFPTKYSYVRNTHSGAAAQRCSRQAAGSLQMRAAAPPHSRHNTNARVRYAERQ